MTENIRITLQALHDAYNALPKSPALNEVEKSFALASAIVRAFLGEEWLDKNIIPNASKRGFLTIDESDPVRKDTTLFRIIDLAEVLYNLQHIEGFDECIARMRAGDIEGTYAELDFGRMLYLNSVPFRYVVPQRAKQLDYDIEIIYPDGVIACADSKCKIDSTTFSEKGIKNALNTARKQLPENRPGIVFVKVPPHWMNEPEFVQTTRRVAKEFLRGTGRIVSVKYYVSVIDFGDNLLRQRHAFDETDNPNNRFNTARSWKLFHTHNPPPEWNGMPPHWQRIIFFPDGKSR